MCIANVYELKTNISKYLELLESGKEKEIIICRYGKKIAIISSYDNSNKKKRIGAAIGKIKYKDFSLEDDGTIANEFGY